MQKFVYLNKYSFLCSNLTFEESIESNFAILAMLFEAFYIRASELWIVLFKRECLLKTSSGQYMTEVWNNLKRKRDSRLSGQPLKACAFGPKHSRSPSYRLTRRHKFPLRFHVCVLLKRLRCWHLNISPRASRLSFAVCMHTRASKK